MLEFSLSVITYIKVWFIDKFKDSNINFNLTTKIWNIDCIVLNKKWNQSKNENISK